MQIESRRGSGLMSYWDNTPTSTSSRRTDPRSVHSEGASGQTHARNGTAHPANSSFEPDKRFDLPDSNNGLLLNPSGPSGADPDIQGHLSGRVASSQYSRDTGSSWSGRVVTRSNTYSSGSGRPFITPRSVSTPNKLVKRSLSQHAPNLDPSASLGGRKHALKRPATSHQRSATLSHQITSKPSVTLSEFNDGTPQTPLSHFEDPSNTRKHLFQVTKSKDSSRGFNARKGPKDQPAIFRIYPNGSRPSLFLATSVTRPELVVDDLLEPDSDTARSEATPLSSSSWSHSPRLRNPKSADFGSPSRIKPRSRPRRSFSISGLLSDSPPRRLRRHQSNAQAKMKRASAQRISSAPVMIMRAASKLEEDNMLPSQHTVSKANVLTYAEPTEHSPPPSELPNTRLRHSSSRPSRYSTTPSDRNSSNPGSLSAPRVFSWVDEEDIDLNSDTVYDSMRTGTTHSSVGAARPGLDSLFDKYSNENSTAMASHGPPPWLDAVRRAAREEGAENRPLKGAPTEVDKQGRKILRHPSVTWNPNIKFADSESFDEGDWDEFRDDSLPAAHLRVPDVADSPDPAGTSVGSPEMAIEKSHKDGLTKSSVFDWSEEPALDGSSVFSTPPRPRTVHGKKHSDSRAIRSTGRRAPSGLHARSQSVPVFQDLTGRRDEVTRKFGTWGIGSKGVTEDWDEDFDFGDAAPQASKGAEPPSGRIDSGVSIPVPETIQRQQSNLLVDIGLLREWGLQIEELKDLRIRAALLGLIESPENVKIFEEVDAMVELADQEAEDDGLAGLRSPASSQHFTDDVFDQMPSPHTESGIKQRSPPHGLLREAHRKSGSAKPSPSVIHESPGFTRPRRDSEAVAKSVIEALQRSKEPAAAQSGSRASPSRKVPFDTATLKHIVPHVKELTRKLKQILRDAEGLNTSPVVGYEASPPLAKAFIDPSEESPSAQRERRMRLSRESSGSNSNQPHKRVDEANLVSRMKIMDVM